MVKEKDTLTIEEVSIRHLEANNKELLRENARLKREIRELENRIKELESKALINPRKVTMEQVETIKRLRANGLSFRAIAKETSLSTCTIQRALNGIYD